MSAFYFQEETGEMDMDATMTGTGKRSSTTAFAIIAGVFCLLHLLPTYLSSWLWIAGFVILALSMFLRMKNVLPAIGFAVLAVDRVVCMAVYGVIDVISILWTLIFLLAAVICFASLTNIMPMQREAFRRLWFLPAVLSAVKWVIAIVWTLHRDSRRILSYGFAEYLSSSGIISTLLQGVFITALMLFALLWAANPDGIPSKGTSKAYCNMALHILLLLFSCGIWYWIWNYRMTRDTNAVRDEAERNPVTKLLLCMFIPFYGIYWTYKTAQRIDKMAWDRNIPSSTAALCLIMVCFSCFLMFLNIAMQMKDQFYKLVALGLGTIYAFQVFLTIGGVTKFIPSTGVTLPLVSYGGSSLLSSMIIFAVIQGLYILRQDEGEINASKSRKNRQNRKKTTGFENADIEKLS